MRILPMLRPFSCLHTKYACKYRAHNFARDFKKGEVGMLMLPMVGEPHMHGGDEHQSMP